MDLLNVDQLCVAYGPSKVVHDVCFSVRQKAVTTILGANGAGKTSILKAISGLVKARGDISFEGQRIGSLSADKIVAKGIAHIPDQRGTFAALTVEENLQVGAITRRDRSGIAADVERMYAYFPWLAERRRQQAGTLSGGEQQMLALARGLMLKPRLLILDEPSFGVAPVIIARIFEILRTLKQQGAMAMLLVEQNAALALDLADDAYLLETGRMVLSGSAAELRENESIQRAYLGY